MNVSKWCPDTRETPKGSKKTSSGDQVFRGTIAPEAQQGSSARGLDDEESRNPTSDSDEEDELCWGDQGSADPLGASEWHCGEV